MNEIYNNGETVIHDDRPQLSIAQAIEMLFEGVSIHLSEPPYEEDGELICDEGYDFNIVDVKEHQRNNEYLYDYLRHYTIAIK